MITYRRLESYEAGKLVSLVKACYGDSYPYSLLYDEVLLEEKLKDQTLISSVAFKEKDELIGHVGIYWEQLENLTADAITGVVLEKYQRQGVFAKLTSHMGSLINNRALLGLHSFAVTTHTGSQKRFGRKNYSG